MQLLGCLKIIPKVKKSKQALDSVLIELIESFKIPDIGFVFFDSYYTSVTLLHDLKCKFNIDSTGTIKKNRTGLPKTQRKNSKKEMQNSMTIKIFNLLLATFTIEKTFYYQYF